MLDQLFKYHESPVRVSGTPEDPLFVAKDVCAVLGLKNITESLRSLDSDELSSVSLKSGGQRRNMHAVTESGLFALIFKSQKEEAKKFRKWVTSEVLPTIRKTGRYDTAEAAQAYTTDDLVADPDLLIRLATEVKQARSESDLNAKKVAALAPVAQFGQEMLDTNSLFTMTQVAKPLGTSAVTLNRFLHDNDIIRKHREEWWPMHRYQNSGHFRIIAHQRVVYDSLSGEQEQRTYHQLKVTPKGRELIHRKWRETGHETPSAPLRALVQS